jgi:hypothetical protein
VKERREGYYPAAVAAARTTPQWLGTGKHCPKPRERSVGSKQAQCEGQPSDQPPSSLSLSLSLHGSAPFEWLQLLLFTKQEACSRTHSKTKAVRCVPWPSRASVGQCHAGIQQFQDSAHHTPRHVYDLLSSKKFCIYLITWLYYFVYTSMSKL